MYKLHKILQRFLCRIPIDSKQGAPGPPTRLCATMCVYPYPYPGAPTLPHAYLHTYMYTSLCMYVMMCVFILLSLSLLCSLSCCLCLSYSSLPSYSLSSRSLLACGKACPWAGAAGFISLVYANVLFYLFISQEYVCIVCIHVSLYIRQYMCMYYSLCMYPTDVCVCT